MDRKIRKRPRYMDGYIDKLRGSHKGFAYTKRIKMIFSLKLGEVRKQALKRLKIKP